MNQTIKRVMVVGLLLLFWVSPCAICAQQADTLKGLRLFMEVCNNYKQLPIHIDLTVHNSADIVTDPEGDTALYNVAFYIQDGGAYIKMGQDEELINDSLLLLISNKTRRMILYPNNGGIKAQLSKLTSGFLQDSSLQKFSAKYVVAEQPVAATQNNTAGTSSIKLESRALVVGSNLPKETLVAKFNTITKQPVEIVQAHRKIIPLDSATYAGLLQNPVYAGKLLHPGARYWFLVKQLSTTYIYRRIDYDKSIVLPLQISGCITRKQVPVGAGSGRYAPAKSYEAYQITENL